MIFNKVKYSEIGKIRSGKRLPKGYVVSENISNNKYIRVRDINNGCIDSKIVQFITDEAASNIQRYRVAAGDVIISAVGTVGAIAEVDSSLDGAYLTENCNNLLVDENVCLKKYLKYYLLSDIGKANIIANTVGSTQPKLPIYGIENFDIMLPDINTQKKIITILDSLNDKIILNNEINNNLHELIRSMYDELVSNADWDEVELSQVASVSSGKRPTTKNETGEYPIIGANGIMAYTNEFNMNSDLIITGRVGTLGVVKRYYKPIWASDNTLIVNTKYLNYIESYLKTIDYNSLNRGSTQPLLTQGDLNKQTLLFSENEVLEFESKVTPIVNKIRFNEEQNEILRQLRDTLLPKLMNGEIALDNIEI